MTTRKITNEINTAPTTTGSCSGEITIGVGVKEGDAVAVAVFLAVDVPIGVLVSSPGVMVIDAVGVAAAVGGSG
ncbi:hypothetical protein H8D57_01755, partial [bacterium]|nr:hypothetical protein [bacterium]